MFEGAIMFTSVDLDYESDHLMVRMSDPMMATTDETDTLIL